MSEHSEAGPSSGAATGDNASAETRFGEFIVERRLGVGGMGAVYLARKESDGLAVALKVLNPVAGVDEGLVKRFTREAQCLLTLDHHNIVKAFDLGSVNGQHFISMEYVPGENLGAMIRREGRVEPKVALGIMRQIADALSYGWKLGVVHRDLKPENILIAPDGTCKLADLGLAVLANRDDLRLTVPGTIMGTPEYMSPEQARGEHDIDTRSDVYSLGCAIYHTICGCPVFEGPSVVAILQKQLSEAPRPPRSIVPGLARGVEQILLKCMEKEPADRFQTCAEIVEAIDRELASAARKAPAPEARKDASRRLAFEDAPPDKPAPSGTSDPDDAAAAVIAHARASASPAAPSVRPRAEPGVPAAPSVRPRAEPGVPAAPSVRPRAEPGVPAAPSVRPRAKPGVPAAPAPGSSPAFRGGRPRRYPTASLGTHEPADGRPTPMTRLMPKRRGGRLPMILLGVVIAGAVGALVVSVLYLFFTTPG